LLKDRVLQVNQVVKLASIGYYLVIYSNYMTPFYQNIVIKTKKQERNGYVLLSKKCRYVVLYRFYVYALHRAITNENRFMKKTHNLLDTIINHTQSQTIM